MGKSSAKIVMGQRTFDLMLRMDEPYRENIDKLMRLPVPLPNGGTLPLENWPMFIEATGPT